MVVNLIDFKVKDLKKVLTDFNKSVRKNTYSGISKMKKGEVITLLNNDFKPKKNPNSINLKHKSGRFTRKLKK